MKVEVESLDRVRKNIEVILDDEKVNELREEIYERPQETGEDQGLPAGKGPEVRSPGPLTRIYVDDELKKRWWKRPWARPLRRRRSSP